MSFWLLLPVFVYFVALLVIAYLTSRNTGLKEGDFENQEYFLAGRGVRRFFAMVSVVATETSVATVILFPQAGFKSAFALVWLCAGFIVGRYIVARFYLGVLYERHHLSIYATMTDGNAGAQKALSLFYLLAKFISNGVRFYIGGFALHHLFPEAAIGVAGWILIIAGIAGIYSLSGGLRAVVITDQIQGYVILLMGAALCGVIAVGIDTDHMRSMLTDVHSYVNFDAQITNAIFSPALFLGALVLSIGSHGADQDMLQRVLATRSIDQARWSMVYSGLGATIVILLYVGIGFLLRESHFDIENSEAPLIDFVRGMNSPVFSGFFAVLLFAAAMSTLDSAMHSTGAIWKSILRDIHKRVDALPGRLFSFVSLLILVASALLFILPEEKNFLRLAMGSMNYVNGGLIAATTMFIHRKRSLTLSGVLTALLTGFLMTFICNHVLPEDWRPGWTYVTIISAAGAYALALPVALYTERNSRSMS
ncbi:MAG: hypothetical protein KDK34_13555 [Leptospiraceae bacterium]|nr:hypothetical protein [Leptospiraceae bacterium]